MWTHLFDKKKTVSKTGIWLQIKSDKKVVDQEEDMRNVDTLETVVGKIQVSQIW